MSFDGSNLYDTRPDLYDLMHAEQVEDQRFVEEFVSSLIQVPSVLELGCGTGRLLVPMLDAGARVTGVDTSSAMLEVARARLGLYGARVSLVEGDMRSFKFDAQFDLSVIGLNTFMHLLTTRDQLLCLESIHRHLRPGGLLLLDLANPHAVMRDTPLSVVQHRFTRRAGRDSDDTVTLWSCTVAAPALQLTQTTLFFDEWTASSAALRRAVVDVQLRLTYRFELELLLQRAGFSIKTVFGDYESGPYEDESERMICVAIAHG